MYTIYSIYLFKQFDKELFQQLPVSKSKANADDQENRIRSHTNRLRQFRQGSDRVIDALPAVGVTPVEGEIDAGAGQ